MRKRVCNKVHIGRLVSLAGASLAFIAVAATLIGLERDEGWGPARKFLLILGLVLIFIPHLRILVSLLLAVSQRFLKYLEDRGFSRFFLWFSERFLNEKPGDRSRKTESTLVRTARINLGTALVFFTAVVAITWIISIGRWTEWPASTNYYHLLAEGFRAGKTHLLVEPDPDLLSLSDPYTYEHRKSIPHIWDASLYEGRYYLYWGPVPALVVVVAEALTPWDIGDHHLVWAFALGSIFFSLLILRLLWMKYFFDLPLWTYWVIIIAAVFVNPFPWMVSRPAIYEAAIQSAQFFFLGGIYWVLRTNVGHEPSKLALFLGGLFLALTVGSRITLAPTVIILSILIVLNIYRRSTQILTPFRGMQIISIYLAPLAIWAVTLAMYNFTRFGSIFEQGHRYALSSWTMVDRYFSFVTSIHNFFPNIYNYFLNPVRILNVFPFIKPVWGKYSIPFLRITAGPFYSTEQVTGLIIAAPIIVFGFVPFVEYLYRAWHNFDATADESYDSLNPIGSLSLNRIYWFLVLATLSILTPLLFFHANSMRYLMDIMPLMILLSAIGFWEISNRISDDWQKRSLLGIMAWGFSLYTVGIGFLLGITGQSARFESLNPLLFEKITRFLSW